MSDKIKTCGRTDSRLKPFFEDLLSEEEYRDFVRHLEQCQKCVQHVRSIGDLSNHLWKMGQINVPSDFNESVLFRWKERTAEIEATEPALSKKWLAAPVIIAGFSIAALFMANFMEQAAVVPAPQVQPEPPASIRVSSPAGDPRMMPETDSVTPVREVAVQPPAILSVSAQEVESLPADGAEKPAVQVSHWHVVYSAENENALLDKRRREKSLRMGLQAEKIKTIEKEIGRLESEESPEDAMREVKKSAEGVEAEVSAIEKSDAEFNLALEELRKNEISSRNKLLGLIGASDVQMISQPSDLIVFSVSSSESERIAEKILSTEQGSEVFQDYTGDIGGSSGKNRSVTIFFDKKGDSAPHWHLRPNDKNGTLAAVRESGGSVDYEDANLTVISIPKKAMPKFRLKLRSAQIGLSQFGVSREPDNVLSDAPVLVSINWILS